MVRPHTFIRSFRRLRCAAQDWSRILAFDARVRERMTRCGLDPRYCFAEDSASDTPYEDGPIGPFPPRDATHDRTTKMGFNKHLLLWETNRGQPVFLVFGLSNVDVDDLRPGKVRTRGHGR